MALLSGGGFYLMTTTPTYNLFFTGRDDPRSCVVIGEDTKPIYFCFETSERNLVMSNTRTIVYRNNKEACAKLEWPGNGSSHSGVAILGSREIPMSHLVLPGSCASARAFVSSDGHQFEWRRDCDSYNLYSRSNKSIAVFQRIFQPTPVGPSHALLQYSFNHDNLLIEALVALCVNRWIDIQGP